MLKLCAEAGVAAGERLLKLGVVSSGRGDETEKREEEMEVKMACHGRRGGDWGGRVSD
jgi:hypothetical protein